MQSITDVWEFVEAYYPKYSSCDEIAENDDLTKIIDGEINGNAETIYNEIETELTENMGFSPEEFQIVEVAQKRLHESNASVFEKAIEGYIESQKLISVESAKQVLKDNGYFVDNLWTVHDVKGNYECTDEQAQKVLNSALQNEATTEQINFAISMHAEFDNLLKKSKFFIISGFWKDTNENFENRIVKELEEHAEDDDENIFYYDLSEGEIQHQIQLGWSGTLDFVITSYEETTLN